MFRRYKHHYLIASVIVSFGFSILSLYLLNGHLDSAKAASITWDGGGADGTCGGGVGDGNKWSCGLNWSTDSVPTSSDTATFDSTSTKNVTIDSAQTITGFTIATGYTGIVTQSADLTVNGSFTHATTDGTFTWSSGILTLGGTNTNWDLDTGDDTFGNVTLDNTNNITVASGDTAIVTGTLTLTNGNINTGTVEARGDVVHGAGFDGGNGTFNITQGASAITLTGGGQLPKTTVSANRTINGPSSGTVSTDDLFSISNGAFVGGAGTFDVNFGLTVSGSASFTAPSGTMNLTGTYTHTDSSTFSANSGTILIDGSAIADVNTTETWSNLNINASFQVTSGDTIIIPSTLTLTNSNIVTGTVEARGDIVHTSGFDGGSGTLNITQGSSDITLVGGGQLPKTTLSVDREIIGPSSGQVIADGLFTLSTGTYTGGAGNLWFLSGLTVSGGTFNGGSGTIDVQSVLTISGTAAFTSTSGTMTVGTNWTHTDSSTFAHNSGTVTFDGATQAIDVNATETFYHLNFTVAGTKTLGSGDALVTEGTLTLSDGTINTGILQPQGGVTLGAAYDGGTSTLTFAGSATQAFDLTGATGVYNGDISVNKSGGQVNLASALVMDAASQDLTITEGKLNTAGQNLTVNGSSGTFVVEDGGNFQLQGAETITLNASNPTLSTGSTVTYVGNGNAGANTYTITTLEDAYHHLVINSADGATDTFQLGTALDVNGNLTLTAGTFDVVSGSNYAITLAGNWSNTATFNARAGTVTLDGTDQTLSGTNTFYNLTKTVAAAATLTLPISVTQTVTGTLTLEGASGQVLSLRSSLAGTQAGLDPQGTSTVQYLNVQDNENVNASTISCTTGCVDSGNNDGWTFSSGGGGTLPITPTNLAITIPSCSADRTIQVRLTATNAASYLVSESSEFLSGSWATFIPTFGSTMSVNFTLSAGDGDKTVYALFRSSTGTLSDTYSDVGSLDETNDCLDPVDEPIVVPDDETETETDVEPEPEPETEPETESEPEATPETEPESEPTPESEPEASPSGEAAPVSGGGSASGAGTESTSESVASTESTSAASDSSGGSNLSALQVELFVASNLLLATTNGKVDVLPDTQMRVVIESDAATKPTSVLAVIDNTEYVLTLDADGTFSGTVPAPKSDGALRVTAIFDDGTHSTKNVAMNVATDEGGVYELTSGERALIEDVSITVYALTQESGEAWDAAAYGLSHPVISQTGRFAWYVPNGTYVVYASKPGYEESRRVVAVPNNILRFSMQLTPLATTPLSAVLPPTVLGDFEDIQQLLQTPEAELLADVALPTNVAITTVTVAVLATSFNFLPYLLYLFTSPLLLFGRRQRMAYGVVYNAFTKTPLELAVVRLYHMPDNRLVKTAVTNAEGKYSLAVQPGEYRLQVIQAGFEFPSTYLKNVKIDGRFLDVYSGQLLRVTDKQAFVTANIPLDPSEAEGLRAPRVLAFRHLARKVQVVVAPLGVLLSIIVGLINPSVLSGSMVVIQLLVLFLVLRLAKPKPSQGWGLVYDDTTHKPVANTVIRVFEPKYNKLVETALSDNLGRYSFLLGPNEYFVTYNKPGYQEKTVRPVDYRGRLAPEPLLLNVTLQPDEPSRR